MTDGASAPVVAIDGPAGTGKSTVARRVAERLGLAYLDTGAMYRAVALAALRRGVDPGDRSALGNLVKSLDLELVPADDGAEIRLDGESVEPEIREPEVGEAASRVAVHPEVRRRLVGIQREYGRRHGVVMEGRDIGTVVFPKTPYKFFLDARIEVRVYRRAAQLRDAGRAVTDDEVRRELLARDERDRRREDSPLTAGPDATRVDTSDRDIDEVVSLIESSVSGNA